MTTNTSSQHIRHWLDLGQNKNSLWVSLCVLKFCKPDSQYTPNIYCQWFPSICRRLSPRRLLTSSFMPASLSSRYILMLLGALWDQPRPWNMLCHHEHPMPLSLWIHSRTVHTIATIRRCLFSYDCPWWWWCGWRHAKYRESQLQTPLHRKPNATDPDDHQHMEYNTCEN